MLMEPKSPTALMINGILLDTVQLRDVFNHKTWASHSPLQDLIKVEHLVKVMHSNPAEARSYLDELQFNLLLVNNAGIYVPDKCFCGGSKYFYVGIYDKHAPAAGKRFVTCMPDSYRSPSYLIECD